MQIRVKFFAIFRETTGLRDDRAEVASGTTAEQLWQQYAARFPRLPKLRAAYAINQRLAMPDQILNEGDEVAFLPPVSGGASKKSNRRAARGAKRKRQVVMLSAAKHLTRNLKGQRSSRDSSVASLPQNDNPLRSSRLRGEAIITRKPIDLNALYRGVAFPGAGAIILFSGVVRDNAQGKAVDHLEYEAYPEMAEQTMRDIIAEIKARWADTRVAMAHRIGRLKIGDASLMIAVASPHRPEAYAASRYAIERVKAILPVWKKEFWTDGEHWVEGPVAGELTAEKAEKTVAEAELAVGRDKQR